MSPLPDQLVDRHGRPVRNKKVTRMGRRQFVQEFALRGSCGKCRDDFWYWPNDTHHFCAPCRQAAAQLRIDLDASP